MSVSVSVSVELAKVLDKEWENKSLSEILAAPVSALAGVLVALSRHVG